ncbi:MAG: S9 family peptidase, partial [Gemmatimonadota bacterium]|nr:S9 family peptidase [Gemmatimonadota bacterium]
MRADSDGVRFSRFLLLLPVLLFLLAAAPQGLDAQEGADDYQMPAAELAALVDAPVAPGISLSPDESVMLLTMRSSLPSIAEVAAPELRIAGLRINPRTNGPSRSRPSNGLAVRTLDGEERAVTGLPANPRIRNTRWSPNGSTV